MNNRKHKIA